MDPYFIRALIGRLPRICHTIGGPLQPLRFTLLVSHRAAHAADTKEPSWH
jgi:hypothetical protein